MPNETLEKAGKSANSIKSILVVVTTTLAIIGSVVTGYGFMDEKYAKASDIVKLEKRMSLSELRDSLRLSLDELYFLKSQTRKYPGDEEIKEQLTDIKAEVKNLKEQIKLKLKKVEES